MRISFKTRPSGLGSRASRRVARVGATSMLRMGPRVVRGRMPRPQAMKMPAMRGALARFPWLPAGVGNSRKAWSS